MDNQQIRSFIAIELPDELKSGLLQLQANMKSNGYKFVKWVAPEGIHITIKFLGNVFSQKLDDITGALERASAGVMSFQLETTELGAFPNLKCPNVLWLGVDGEVGMLANLQKKIDDALEPLGFAREKRAFTPHLTIARIRESASPQNRWDFGELITKTRFEVKYKIEVKDINLMKSQLLPVGAVYSCLAQIRLKRP